MSVQQPPRSTSAIRSASAIRPASKRGDKPVPQQTQREGRLMTILLMAKLFSAYGETLCRIRNLSSGGLMMEAQAPLAEGEAVQIELKVGDRLAGHVRWVLDDRFGIAFDEPIEVDVVLARATVKTTEQGLVRSPRFVVDCPVELRRDGRRFAARLISLSQGGAGFETDLDVEQDQLLTLAIPGLSERQGGVRWRRDDVVGLAFTVPLAFEELSIWLAGQAQKKPGDSQVAELRDTCA